MNAISNQARAIFLEAIELHTPDSRAEFLDRACEGDAELRGRVERLLQSHELLGTFHETADTRHLTPDTLLERPGSIIGPYKLLQQIGEGGMGVVFMAEQMEPIHRTVALKIIKPGMDTRQVIARFEAERQALAMMDHPNIARVLDAGTTGAGGSGLGAREESNSSSSPASSAQSPAPRPFFVMDLVKGIPITDYCDHQHLSVRRRLELMTQVCHAVQHAHQKGIIHRDLKPSNVLVAEYDGKPVPKVIDFGVAKATAQRLTDRTMFTQYGQIVGTFEYMSPEQARFNQLDVDTRSDIYSLGVMLYSLLTGSTPFEKQRLETVAFDETLRLIREEEPQPPSTRLSSSESLSSIAVNRSLEPNQLSGLVRGELDWIVLKCLEKDRTRRYETANGLAQDIDRYLHDEPVQAGPPTTSYRFRKFARRHKVALITTAIVAFSLLLGTIISLWQATVARHAKALAESRLKSEADARQQASAISDTLQRMLQSADPYEANGADYTVREMLDDFSAGLGDKLEDQPATKAELRAIIGQTYRQLGLTDKAEPHLKAALDLRRKAFGSDHELVAHSLIDYAWLLRACDDSAGAEKFAREALALQQKLGARDPDLMLANLHLLQNTVANQRRFDDAEDFAQQGLAIARAHQNPLSGEANIRCTMADVAVMQGDFVKAERLAREALERHRKLHGDYHSTTAAGWQALGYAFYRQKKFDEAEKCFNEARAVFVKSHGYCPINVLALLAVIFDAKAGQDDLNELRPLADEEEEKSGPYGWEKAASRGSLRAMLGDWEKADAYLAKAVELAPDDAAHECAKADCFLALLRLRALDQPGYLAACLAGVERQSTKRDPAYYLVVWASVIAPGGSVEPARLVELAERTLESSPEDPDYLTASGAALYRDGRWDEAQMALTKAIHAYGSFRGTVSGTVTDAQLFLAMTNHRLGKVKEARQWLDIAIDTIEHPTPAHQNSYRGMSWDRRLTAQLLRDEAEQLLMNHNGTEASDYKK